MMQIYTFLDKKEDPELLSVFLTGYVDSHPEDPFNAYYLFTVAERYKQQEGAPFAHYYFSRILHSYTDVTYQGQSIHFLCLKEILGNSQDLEENHRRPKQRMDHQQHNNCTDQRGNALHQS